MKKAIAVLAALAMLFVLTACGTDVIPTKAPTQPAETQAPAPAQSTQAEPAATTPAAAEPAVTTPAETQPAATTPAETTPAPTTPAPTTPAETTPAPTTPAETTPAPTAPPETEPVADKAAYYETYFGSEDMKPAGSIVRMAMLANRKEAYAMTAGGSALMIEAEGGRIEMYQQEDKLLAHIYAKPYADNEGEDRWMSCAVPEGENPFESFGEIDVEEIFAEQDVESTTLTYQFSYPDDGVEYDVVLMTSLEEPYSPEMEPVVVETMMLVRADTHEIVRMEMETGASEEDPEVTEGMRIDFLKELEPQIPEGITIEEEEYETVLMAVFMTMMVLMGMGD